MLYSSCKVIPDTVGGSILPSKGGVAMDDVNLIYLVLILFLLKEIIQISGNKKR